MNMPNSTRIYDIPLNLIDVADRLRPVDHAELAKIRISMSEIGQLEPVRLREADANGRHKLIYGAHRYQSALDLGWPTIKATLVAATDDEAQLQEIDENLCRHELNPLDRAVFLAKRQALYERLHPETRNGGDRRRPDRQVGELKAAAFYREVAERTGISTRTVSRALTLAKGLAPDAIAVLRGTALAANQSELQALSKVAQVHQAAVASAVLQGQAKRVAEARAMVLQERKPRADANLAYRKLVATFSSNKTTPSERRDFIAWLVKAGHMEAYGVERTAQPAKKGGR